LPIYNKINSFLKSFHPFLLVVLSRAFKEWPKNATIWQGETARFACQAKRAIPDPVISWEKNGHKVTPGGRYVILTTGVLQILQVQKSDEGFYRCVIQNIVRQRLSVKGWLAVRQGTIYLHVHLFAETL